MMIEHASQALVDGPSMPPGYLKYVNFSNETVYIHDCDLGYGLFASRDLSKGELILTFEGPLISFLQTKTKGSWECMPLQIDHDLYIDTLPVGVFVNHSCSPNAGIKQDKDLVAITTIKRGEEIRFDYSTTMQEDSFTMKCRCGQIDCRGIVDDFDTLPFPKQLSYLREGVVMSFIAKKHKGIEKPYSRPVRLQV
jgi:hypothetical protein